MCCTYYGIVCLLYRTRLVKDGCYFFSYKRPYYNILLRKNLLGRGSQLKQQSGDNKQFSHFIPHSMARCYITAIRSWCGYSSWLLQWWPSFFVSLSPCSSPKPSWLQPVGESFTFSPTSLTCLSPSERRLGSSTWRQGRKSPPVSSLPLRSDWERGILRSMRNRESGCSGPTLARVPYVLTS